MAANPATRPPITPVIKISNTDEPPSGRTCAIFADKTLLFFISIQNARPPHNKNMERKPAKNAFIAF